MALPHLTVEQRKEALNKATAARKRRAEISASLKAGSLGLADVIEMASEDDAVARMRVSTLIKSLPGVGPHRAKLAMENIGISETRRIRGLGPLQKEGLLLHFTKPID